VASGYQGEDDDDNHDDYDLDDEAAVELQMKTLNLRKGQRTKQRNRILVDLISNIWDSKN